MNQFPCGVEAGLPQPSRAKRQPGLHSFPTAGTSAVPLGVLRRLRLRRASTGSGAYCIDSGLRRQPFSQSVDLKSVSPSLPRGCHRSLPSASPISALCRDHLRVNQVAVLPFSRPCLSSRAPSASPMPGKIRQAVGQSPGYIRHQPLGNASPPRPPECPADCTWHFLTQAKCHRPLRFPASCRKSDIKDVRPGAGIHAGSRIECIREEGPGYGIMSCAPGRGRADLRRSFKVGITARPHREDASHSNSTGGVRWDAVDQPADQEASFRLGGNRPEAGREDFLACPCAPASAVSGAGGRGFAPYAFPGLASLTSRSGEVT